MKNIVEMQTSFNGEWEEIWYTYENNLELALSEIDEEIVIPCCVRFKNTNDFVILNGGY